MLLSRMDCACDCPKGSRRSSRIQTRVVIFLICCRGEVIAKAGTEEAVIYADIGEWKSARLVSANRVDRENYKSGFCQTEQTNSPSPHFYDSF